MEPILDRNILAEGSEECGRIARKLRRVSEAFDGRWAPGELPKGVSAKVEELTAEYERIEGVLAQCCEYLNGEWTRIENNRARLSEVETFLESFRVLRTEALILDDCCLEDKRRAFDLFGEYNTSMEYVFLVGKTLERLGFIVKYLAEVTEPSPRPKSKYEGIEKRLRPHAMGLNDQDYECLIERHELPLFKGTWTGRKCDATYFGQWFGLDCKYMNGAFIFYDEKGREVKLHYKHNDADGVGLNDDIYKAIKDFPKKKSPGIK